MSITAKYLLNGNVTDSSGNGRDGSISGAGPTFTNVYPKSLVGAGYTKDFTDVNNIDLPTSVYTGVTTTGTIKFSFFVTGYANKVAISSNHGAYGNFFIYINNSNSFVLRVPTASGSSQFTTSIPYALKTGRWYTLFLYWVPGSFKVDIKDSLDNSITNMENKAINANFSLCSAVKVGRDTIVSNFAWPYYIHNIEFRDDATNVESETCNPQNFIASFGHSYVQGTYGVPGNCGTPGGDGWRTSFQNYVSNILSENYLLVGQTSQGTTLTPFTDGQAGAKIADVDGYITAKLNLDFTGFDSSNNYIVMIGPIEYNDVAVGTNLNTYKASYLSVINKISAVSNEIKIMIVTGPSTPNGANVASYSEVAREIYLLTHAAGKNVYLKDWAKEPIFDWCEDDIHPSTIGYEYMGNYITRSIYNIIHLIDENATVSGFYLI